jgi:hypothetical protein
MPGGDPLRPPMPRHADEACIQGAKDLQLKTIMAVPTTLDPRGGSGAQPTALRRRSRYAATCSRLPQVRLSQ